MKIFIWFSLILLILTLPGMAQAGFRPGFIIKNNGDTLNGQIFYSVEGQYKKTCKFRRFEIAREFNYFPDDIKAFGFRNGRYFESRREGNKKSFFECILKGETSVFVRAGKPKSRIYLENPLTGFFRLSKGYNNLDGVGTFNSYGETLKYLIEKSASTQVSINSINYDAREIASVLREAHTGIQDPPRAFHATHKVRYISDYSLTGTSLLYKIGVNGGYQFLTPEITGDRYSDYFREADYNTTFRPAIGIYINRKLSKKSRHASVELGINYLTDSYYGYSERQDGAAFDRNDIMLDFTALQVPLSVKLTYGKQKIHPYIKAGAFKSFLIQSSYNRRFEHEFQNEIDTEIFSDFELKGEFGFQGGPGVEFDLGLARSVGIDVLYIWGSQLLNSNKSLDQRTNLESSGFGIMMHINF